MYVGLFDISVGGRGLDGPVIEDLSVQMERGVWHDIVGRSGAGKSLLYGVLSLQRKPEKGRLVVAGRNLERLDEGEMAELRQCVGSCGQRPVLLEERSAVENVVLPMVVRGQLDGAVEAAEETLGFLGVMPQRDRAVEALSEQERRLVGVARATVGQPEVILIDGVHEDLEPAVRGVVYSWLERCQKAGSTVFIFGRRPSPRRDNQQVWRLGMSGLEPTDEVARC